VVEPGRQKSSLFHLDYATQATSDETTQIMLLTTPMDQLTQHHEQANFPFRLIIQQCLGEQLRTRTSFQLSLTLILYLTPQDQQPTRHNPMELDTTLLQRETIPDLQGCEPRTKLGKPYRTSKGAGLQGCEAVNTSTLHCKGVLGILRTYSCTTYLSSSRVYVRYYGSMCIHTHDTM
jgi:hypothetical protein